MFKLKDLVCDGHSAEKKLKNYTCEKGDFFMSAFTGGIPEIGFALFIIDGFPDVSMVLKQL